MSLTPGTRVVLHARAILLVVTVVACASCNRFDQSQVPVVTVGSGLRPEISWTPSPAYTLTVYPGEKDLDGLGSIWYASVGSAYANNLKAPVTYGVPPPGADVAPSPPLEEGKTYTVVVLRKDEKGSGEGFSNTRHRYVGTKTFVAKQ